MKKLLSLLLVLLSALCNAQVGNGGMGSENAHLKMEYLGTSNGMVTIRVTNKDTCDENVSVQWGNVLRTKTIQGLSSDTFIFEIQNPCMIMARAISNCSLSNLGQVEISYCVLPVTFEYLYIRQISNSIIEVEFKLSQSDGENHFNVQFSKDGKNFKTVSVVTAEPLVINKVYKVKIKI